MFCSPKLGLTEGLIQLHFHGLYKAWVKLQTSVHFLVHWLGIECLAAADGSSLLGVCACVRSYACVCVIFINSVHY